MGYARSVKVVFPAPPAWQVEERDGLTFYDVGEAGCQVMVTPLRPCPEDMEGWLERLCMETVPPGAQVTALYSRPVETEEGWPARISELIVSGAGNETRLVVQYTFFEHGAGAVVRCPDAAAFAGLRPAVMEALRRARPDWGDQALVCLERLLDGAVARQP